MLFVTHGFISVRMTVRTTFVPLNMYQAHRVTARREANPKARLS